MKKVVVFFPYHDSKDTLGQKTFETKDGYLEVNNTEDGNLVILSKIESGRTRSCETLAVFKDWIYWERIE